MTDPNDHDPFPLKPTRERDTVPTEPGIGMLPKQRRPLPPPLPPALPKMSGPVTMPSPFPPGSLQERFDAPKPSGWRVLLSKRGLAALALILGLAADAVGTAYPGVTGVIGGAQKVLELLH